MSQPGQQTGTVNCTKHLRPTYASGLSCAMFKAFGSLAPGLGRWLWMSLPRLCVQSQEGNQGATDFLGSQSLCGSLDSSLPLLREQLKCGLLSIDLLMIALSISWPKLWFQPQCVMEFILPRNRWRCLRGLIIQALCHPELRWILIDCIILGQILQLSFLGCFCRRVTRSYTVEFRRGRVICIDQGNRVGGICVTSKQKH